MGSLTIALSSNEFYDNSSASSFPSARFLSINAWSQFWATHLLWIVLSECAFLVWKIRCRRLLDTSPEDPEKAISPKEARNQTLSLINSRPEENRALTSKRKYGKDAIPEDLILSTWSGTLQDESSLPTRELAQSQRGFSRYSSPYRSRLSPTHQRVKAFPRGGFSDNGNTSHAHHY